MRQTNTYHFADLRLSLPDKSTRDIPVLVEDLADARAARRLLLVTDEATALTAADSKGDLATAQDRLLQAAARRLKTLREKHGLPEGTLVQDFRALRRRRQLDHDPKAGDPELDLSKALPATMAGEVRRALHVCVEWADGHVEVEAPSITAAAAKRRIAELRTRPNIKKVYAAFRIVLEEDATAEV